MPIYNVTFYLKAPQRDGTKVVEFCLAAENRDAVRALALELLQSLHGLVEPNCLGMSVLRIE